MEQAARVAGLPITGGGVAVMPDVHYGKGATVGSVIAMRQALAPAAVGVDIGCGMSAVATNLTDTDLPDDLGALRAAVEAAIPVGFHAHDDPVDPRRVHGLATAGWDEFWSGFGALTSGVGQLEARATRQMGTLGGGNHFIELCVERRSPRVWLMLHSGSRNIGKDRQGSSPSRAACRTTPTCPTATWRCSSPARRDGGLPARPAGRRSTPPEPRGDARAVLRRGPAAVARCGSTTPISCHHNYVAEETYGGVELLVTRKGAIRAGRGPRHHPGLMGTGTYIVRGLGNAEAFCSLTRRRPADVAARGQAHVHVEDPRPRRPASSAARTPGSSTRSRAPTRTSARSSRARPTSWQSSPTSSRSSA